MGIADLSRAKDGLPSDILLVPKHVQIKPKPHGTPPQDLVVPQMHIEAIPAAMRQMGWNVSAALMERWFASPGWAMPEDWKKPRYQPPVREISSSHLDKRIVSMEWAMQYARCQAAVRDLAGKLNTPPTLALLKQRLDRTNWNGHGVMHLGRFGMSAIQLEDLCQVNFVGFGEPDDTMDDAYGALGSATMKMAFVGRALRSDLTGRDKFLITHAGFYIRDNYDFNGDQFLGTWTEFGVMNKAEMAADVILGALAFDWHGEPIGHASNAHFRAFRKETGRGGDFVLYSDVHWQEIDVSIELP